jgi:hypothetical protein
VQNVVLAALLVVDDELHRDARVFRSVGEGGRAPVADHVARIGLAVRHLVLSPRPGAAVAGPNATTGQKFAPARSLVHDSGARSRVGAESVLLSALGVERP